MWRLISVSPVDTISLPPANKVICDSVQFGGGSLSRGVPEGGICQGAPYGKERAVRILLEFFLVKRCVGPKFRLV